jgi:hypothetical protein
MEGQKTIHCMFHHGSRSKAPKDDLGHQDIIFVKTLSILHGLQFRNGVQPWKHSFLNTFREVWEMAFFVMSENLYVHEISISQNAL